MTEEPTKKEGRKIPMVQVKCRGEVYQGTKVAWIRWNKAFYAASQNAGNVPELCQHGFRQLAPSTDIDVTAWTVDAATAVVMAED